MSVNHSFQYSCPCDRYTAARLTSMLPMTMSLPILDLSHTLTTTLHASSSSVATSTVSK